MPNCCSKNKISISGRRDTPTGHCWKKTLPTELVTYYVTAAADSHGKGLGVKIYEEAEKLARSRKASSVRADTHQENIAMQRTMEKSGFLPCGIIHIKGGEEDGQPRIAVEKPLF